MTGLAPLAEAEGAAELAALPLGLAEADVDAAALLDAGAETEAAALDAGDAAAALDDGAALPPQAASSNVAAAAAGIRNRGSFMWGFSFSFGQGAGVRLPPAACVRVSTCHAGGRATRAPD